MQQKVELVLILQVLLVFQLLQVVHGQQLHKLVFHKVELVLQVLLVVGFFMVMVLEQFKLQQLELMVIFLNLIVEHQHGQM